MDHRQVIAAEFAQMVDTGNLGLPLPGGGQTRERWAALTAIAERDLALARLAEGHADAIAILAELGSPDPPPGSRWGVWAAEPPGFVLTADQASSREWRLTGLKPYCSGARCLTHALVTARDGPARRLFRVETGRAGISPLPGSWPAAAMAASDTLDMRFQDVPAVPVGGPGAYLDRPGFQHGGIGVAACWYGGARAVAATLVSAGMERDLDPHALAHLGAADAALEAVDAALDRAAAQIDADPLDRKGTAALRSKRVRALTEAVASDVLARVGRALGAAPLGHDAQHARNVADLTVYLRQHHAERDLAGLGESIVAARRAASECR